MLKVYYKKERIKIKGLKVSFLEIKPEKEKFSFLILHGWGSKGERWVEVGKFLAENGYRVIIPDLPGFGESEEPLETWGLDDYSQFIDEFVKSLDLEEFHLLGHSFGGSLAVKYSLKFPQKVKKLFLVGAACCRRITFKKKIYYFLAKKLKYFSFLPGYSFFRKIFYRFIIRKSDYPYAQGIMKKILLKVLKEDLISFLPSIIQPTIIIWGKKDDITPLRDGRLINQKIKNSKLVIIPQGKHNLEVRFAKELGEIIIQEIN